MEGPLSLVFKFGHGTEMLLGLFVGMGFGFTLERAGFGRSDNLAAIFYGRNFRVLRVMFTAIVTAMLGLYFLDLLRVLPLGSIGILDTYLPAQGVGGALVGVGFIIGGYCPGTGVVAAVSGKMDGLAFLGGMLAGTTVFTIGYDSLAAFQRRGFRGRVLLSDFLHVPSGIVVFGVVMMALGAFFAAAKIERLVNRASAATQRSDP